MDDIQINLSYLFDLDWHLPAELSILRSREKQLAEIRNAARSNAFGSIIETVAQLRPKLAASESKAADLRERANSFVVVDQYHSMVREVSSLRQSIRELATANLIDQEQLDQLRTVVSSELPAGDALLDTMYDELTINLPETISRRLEEVKAFHRSVAENRRADLVDNITELESRIAERLFSSRNFDERRSELMAILNGAGALEDFVFLQEELAVAQQELADLRRRFENARFIEERGSTLAVERSSLERRIRADHDLRDAVLRHAASIIDRLVGRLYDDRSGKLLVEATNNGPRFEIVIEGDRSEGIGAMEIWCFDMLLSQLCSERLIGPRILVHDSHLFADVDNRQASLALEIGRELAIRFGFQYIVTMNSDQFDRLTLNDDIRHSVIDTRLFDGRESGGLFGVIVEDQRNSVLSDTGSSEEHEVTVGSDD